jgi:hypothetical protein
MDLIGGHMDDFNYDVRVGLAHIVEQTAVDIAEMYDVGLEDIQTKNLEAIKELPPGIAILISNLYGISALLVVESDDQSVELLSEMNRRIVPVVVAQMVLPTEEEGGMN